MFSKLRDPRGGYTLLAAGLACLVLAGFLGAPLLPGPVGVGIMGGFTAAGAACIWTWWRRRRAAGYDLTRLWEEPSPSEDVPYEDTIPPDEEGAPYCGWCDEAYPPGTGRCLRCGRDLG
jgi:hypothetical protein